MSPLTETGTFPVGIVVDGVRHITFELRPATVGDNVDAIEELGGDASQLRISVAIYARQLVALGTLPQSQITAALVHSLAPADFNALEEVHDRLKKKLLEFGMPWSGGTPAGSSLPGTA